jgi:DNA oxidative demethylase
VIAPQDRIALVRGPHRGSGDRDLRTTEDGNVNLQSTGAGAGLRLHPGYLDADAQAALLAAVRGVLAVAPLFTPRMPKSGRPFTVRMSNCGTLGWVSDADGYRYQPLHPDTGERWPPVPEQLLSIWNALARYPHPPEACLINVYGAGAKMGLHQDRDEAELAAPVVSISLGDSCLFRVGGLTRQAPT